MRNRENVRREKFRENRFLCRDSLVWSRYGRSPGLRSRLVVVSILIAVLMSALLTSKVSAELNSDIDLTLSPIGFRNVSQRATLWTNLTIGPTQDVEMGECGCLLAALSALFEYEWGSSSLPWFPTEFSPFGFPIELFDFNPYYLDLFFNSGPNQADEAGWGYKLRNGCGVMPKPFAVATAANSGGKPTGLTWNVHPSLRTARAKALVDGNLLRGTPTIVVRRITPEEVKWITGKDGPAGLHAQLIVGWDNREKKYRIVDPLEDAGASAKIPTTLKGSYEDWVNSTVNIFETQVTAGGSSSLVFGDDPSPIEIHMTNPEGQKVGFDPVTKENFQEDPSASYWNLDGWVDPLGRLPLADPIKFITVQDPIDGTYRFQVIGTGDGPFTISAAVVTGAAETVLQTVSDTITKDEVRKFEVHYSTNFPSTVSEVTNFTPAVKVGTDVKGRTDMPVEFDGRRSFDVDGSIASYAWDFGDGASGVGEQVSHVYTVPGVYTVRLTATDDGGATATATLQASIILSQRRPVATLTGPYLGFVSTEELPAVIDLNGSKSSDPNGDPLTFKWDLGDGSSPFGSTFPFVQHAYMAPGIYTVTLIVNDGVDDSEPVATTVEVLPSPESRSPRISVLPSCGPAGTPITFRMEPFTLMSFGGAQSNLLGWDFGADGPLPPIPDRISLGIPGTPDGKLRLRVQGPTGTADEFLSWTAIRSAPVEYAVKISWTIPSSWEPGVYQFIVGEELTALFQVPCPEPDNHRPLAHAGGPSYVGSAGAPITFDGSLSIDPDGDPLTYLWSFGDGATGTGMNPQHTYAAPGNYPVTLVVNDGKLSSSTTIGTHSFAEANVSAGSNHPVNCSLAKPSLDMLKPPDHRLVPVQIIGLTDSDNDPITVAITHIAQDEPVSGLGYHDISPDAVGVGTDTVRIRAERFGKGDGRVYHLDFTADDGKGGFCSGTVTVCAPNSHWQKNTCIDQGRLFDSTALQ